MTVPDYQSYMAPMLNLLSDGQARHINEISDVLAVQLQLSESDLLDMVPSGKKTRHVDRVGWAATYLKQAGLLLKPARGWYQLSEIGHEVVRTGERVDTVYLWRFPEFQKFKARKRDNGTEDDSSSLALSENILELPTRMKSSTLAT